MTEQNSKQSPGVPEGNLSEKEIVVHLENIKKEEHSNQVEELLKIAKERGVVDAVKVAERVGNPHLLDDFHDRLALESLAHPKNK